MTSISAHPIGSAFPKMPPITCNNNNPYEHLAVLTSRLSSIYPSSYSQSDVKELKYQSCFNYSKKTSECRNLKSLIPLVKDSDRPKSYCVSKVELNFSQMSFLPPPMTHMTTDSNCSLYHQWLTWVTVEVSKLTVHHYNWTTSTYNWTTAAA